MFKRPIQVRDAHRFDAHWSVMDNRLHGALERWPKQIKVSIVGKINVMRLTLFMREDLLFDYGIWNLHHVESCHTHTRSLFTIG